MKERYEFKEYYIIDNETKKIKKLKKKCERNYNNGN